MDERYYPNPEAFNPDNFSREARAARNPYTFFGFGQGPRACIGMRFAMLEMKLAMVELLTRFSLLPSDKNPETFVMDPGNELGFPKGGVFGRFQKRQRD